MGKILEVKNLTVHIKTHKGIVQAVRGVDFYLNEQETLAVVGESGSGKSITMKGVMGILPKNGKVVEGSVMFQGNDLTKYSERQMQQVRGSEIAMIFQDPMTSLNPTMKVGKQIEEMLKEHRKEMSKADRKARAIELLSLVGISNPEARYDQYPHQLSGGMRQRVVIAIALACDPKVLIADEPTTALDVTIQAQILDLMRDLQKKIKTSIIIITHNLGVVANIADLTVKQELDSLYEEDADWNILLADANDNKVTDEKEFKDFIEGFKSGTDAQIPVSSIYPKFSTVVYQSYAKGWHPEDFYKGIRGYDKLDYQSYDINENEKLLVAVMAKEQNVEGIKVKDVRTMAWSYLVLFWDEKKNLLYINSLDNASLYHEVAKHVVGAPGKAPKLISGVDVFKTFHNLKRTKLRNVGLKVYLGKDIRFRMHAGRDVENGLSRIEKMNSEKSFVVGDGFENGEKTSIGASYKGRIWSLSGNGNILAFKNWCIEQGEKLTNPNIDANQILKETLIPKMIKEIPVDTIPFSIDWDDEMWRELETRYSFKLLGSESYMYNTEIELCENALEGNKVRFAVCNSEQHVEFQLELFENNENEKNKFPDYRIKQLTHGEALIQFGTRTLKLTDFFEKEENVPIIYFTDGSSLRGNEYIVLSATPTLYDKNSLQEWDWEDVNLLKESQGVRPHLKTDSIQYNVIQTLVRQDYDIVYDDDNAGEIADVITLKLIENEIHVELYHLKFAHEGKITSQIANFYEVCGQAQKSANWKYKEAEEMLNHLLRREIKKSSNGDECSRIYKGTHEKLIELMKLAKRKLPVKYSVFIVQPGVSKDSASDEILSLLGVTESFLKERTGIELKVIVNKKSL